MNVSLVLQAAQLIQGFEANTVMLKTALEEYMRTQRADSLEVAISVVTNDGSALPLPLTANQRAILHLGINRAMPPDRPATVVDPVAAEASAPALPGKTWRGTGKMAATADGQLAEIGTWINPAGEAEAVRLTKATGIPHSVDPRTGEIVRAGGGTVDVGAAPALIPDQKPIEFNPDTLVQFDVRPVLNASALVPEPRHQIA